MRLCAAQRCTVLRNKKKTFERDESLHMKTHKRTEKRCGPHFFYHVSFSCVYARRTGARLTQIKRKLFAVKKNSNENAQAHGKYMQS